MYIPAPPGRGGKIPFPIADLRRNNHQSTIACSVAALQYYVLYVVCRRNENELRLNVKNGRRTDVFFSARYVYERCVIPRLSYVKLIFSLR